MNIINKNQLDAMFAEITVADIAPQREVARQFWAVVVELGVNQDDDVLTQIYMSFCEDLDKENLRRKLSEL